MLLIGWVVIVLISIFKVVPMGVWFVWGLFNVLYCLFTMLQPKTYLTKVGRIELIAGLFIAIITGLKLFADYDIISVLIK